MVSGQTPTSANISADDLHSFADERVAIGGNAPSTSFTAVPLRSVLRVFHPLYVVHDVAAVHALPDKQCMSDLLPTKLLNDNVDLLAPIIVNQCNRSLAVGVVTSTFALAYITPGLASFCQWWFKARFNPV